jgi:hypothetical protein
LEKQHGGSPDRGAAAKPRQDLLANKRLNLKQQKCAGKNGQRKWEETPGVVGIVVSSRVHCPSQKPVGELVWILVA